MGKRQAGRERIEAQIVELGRQHLVTHGAAGLSLRAIARDLGMVSSAVYRYVASRDELLTLLLVHAYSDLADAVDDARSGVHGGWRDEVLAIARAMRQWALAQPASWALLFGNPVPGYQAPAERTTGPGTRVIATLLSAVADGVIAGDVRLSGPGDVRLSGAVGVRLSGAVDNRLLPDFDRIRAELAFPGDDALLCKCFLTWAGIVGAISLEVYGWYGADTLTAPESLFDTQVQLLIDVLAG